MCQKMAPKSTKLKHHSLSQQKSIKFCKDLTLERIFFTPTLFAQWHVFPSLDTILPGFGTAHTSTLLGHYLDRTHFCTL